MFVTLGEIEYLTRQVTLKQWRWAVTEARQLGEVQTGSGTDSSRRGRRCHFKASRSIKRESFPNIFIQRVSCETLRKHRRRTMGGSPHACCWDCQGEALANATWGSVGEAGSPPPKGKPAARGEAIPAHAASSLTSAWPWGQSLRRGCLGRFLPGAPGRRWKGVGAAERTGGPLGPLPQGLWSENYTPLPARWEGGDRLPVPLTARCDGAPPSRDPQGRVPGVRALLGVGVATLRGSGMGATSISY